MSIKNSTLSNGMRVVTHAMPHLRTVSLGVWVETGARSEAPEQHGISHLLEHMAFKGTTRRQARDIVEQIESVGGDINAATSLDMTSYYARVLKDDVELAMDILSDILINPLFDETELSREREVVFQEIASAQDSPEEIAYDLVQEAAFPDQPLGRPILGTVESVGKLSPASLREYQRKHYNSHNMVFSAAGALEHEQIVDFAEKYFASLTKGPKFAQTPATYKGGLRLSEKPFEQSHIIVGFEGFPVASEHFFAAQVFSSLFGGGMSSRLFQEVREKHGLCYSIYAFTWGLADTGLFCIHAATGREQIPRLLDVITEELLKMGREGPEEREVAKAKAQLKAGLTMSLENSGARAEQLARQMINFGRPLNIDELIEKVENVEGDDVCQLVTDLISRGLPVCSGVGPLGNFETYEAFTNQFN